MGNNWQGDVITDYKDDTNIRLMFHNINGINLHGNNGLESFIHEQVTSASNDPTTF